jgi:hypothetical protein
LEKGPAASHRLPLTVFLAYGTKGSLTQTVKNRIVLNPEIGKRNVGQYKLYEIELLTRYLLSI